MATPDRPGTCANCGGQIRKRRIRGAGSLASTVDSPSYHYTCGTCMAPRLLEDEEPNPRSMTLDQWKRRRGTRTGTQTFNGVTYTDLNEIEWRKANNDWLRPS